MKPLLKTICLSCLFAFASATWAAEWKSAFTVPVGIGYTDNADLQPDSKKTSDFFWRTAPGFSILANAPRWNTSINYSYLWERHSKDEKHSDNHRLDARFGSELVDNLFFLDANAAISQVRENQLGPIGFETQNLNDVFTWRVQPALKRRFANTSQVVASVAAYGLDASGSLALQSGVGRIVNANYSSGGLMDALRLDLLASDDRFQYDQFPYSNAVRDETLKQSASARLTSLMSRTITPYVSYGYENIEDVTLRRQPSESFWNAGFVWLPSVRTKLDANFGKRFFGDTRNIAFTHQARSTRWLLSYVQDLRSGQEDVLVPSSVNIFNQWNASLSSVIPDPIARASVVRALMDSQGISPTSILATRNYVDKKLAASVDYTTPRTSSRLDLFARDSDASEVSVPVPPSAVNGGLGDRTRQKGASLNWNYRMGPKLRFSSVIGLIDESYPDVSISDSNQFVRLGLTYQMSRYISTNSEVRRVQRSSNVDTREYTENSIVLSVIGSF